ncbi:MAG: TIGR00159 family protein [Candidatus Cloacimonas sp. 4484_275]|nr:MAG: TIGR00159 family protein [Candidatus Cloacimonas sp. 4484_275]RLC52907.1 MAG: TIGR00159 family protein [Candidatus Cloacimonadota bacterium]
MSFLIPTITDIADILIVAFLLYRLFILSRRAGGAQILIGLGILILLFFLSSVLNLRMITSFLKILKDNWVLAFIILFQPEIRNFFARLAQNDSLSSIFKNVRKSVNAPLLNAISIMSLRKIGALIVIENKRNLNDLIEESGEIIDAQISIKLLLTIFNDKTILHDGAVIIRKNRIYACKVVLPLSKNAKYAQQYGTRHLAAIGITEISDALAIVVSEESGKISVAKDGIITGDLTIDELSQRIKDETS